jgi:membrane-associated phospholipid phosphatase
MAMLHRRTTALWIAAGCAVLALLVWVLAFQTSRGQSADLAGLEGFGELRSTWLAGVANDIAHLCDPAPFALLSLAVAGVALVTRGVRASLVVAAILVLPNLLAQELKTTLATDRIGSPLVTVDAASWPSGHSTAAMALALCAVIAAPSALRWVVAVGGALFAVIVGYAVVVFAWHFPSDVLGGFAIAGAGGALGVAALRPTTAARTIAFAVPLTAALLVGAGAVLLWAAHGLPSTRQQLAFMAFGGAICALGLVLSGALAGWFSRPAATTALPSRSRRATG